MRLLDIQFPRGESSNSIALTNAFITASRRVDSSIYVDTLNVWNEGLPEFDSEAIGAKSRIAGRHRRVFPQQGFANQKILFAPIQFGELLGTHD